MEKQNALQVNKTVLVSLQKEAVSLPHGGNQGPLGEMEWARHKKTPRVWSYLR